MTQQNTSLETDVDPMEILRSSLAEAQFADTQEAAARMVQSQADMVRYEAQAQTSSPTNASPLMRQSEGRNPFNDALDSMIANAGTYIGTFDSGSTDIATSPNVRTRRNSDGTTDLFVIKAAPGKDVLTSGSITRQTQEVLNTNVNPTQSVRNNMSSYQPYQGQGSFDVGREMAKLHGLKGDELVIGIETMLANVDVQIAKEMQRINAQAAVQAGYTSAQSALERAIAQEHIPNPNFGGLSFNQRFGVASAQTVQAEAMASSARVNMMALEGSLAKRDVALAQLNSAKAVLLKHESIKAQAQMRSELAAEERTRTRAEREAQKNRELEDRVPDHMKANYKILFGESMDDASARSGAYIAATKDKELGAVLNTNPDTVYQNILSPQLKSREQTLRLINEWDKRTNPEYANSQSTPAQEMLREFIKDPGLLLKKAQEIGVLKGEELKQFTSKMAAAEMKEKEPLRQSFFANVLSRYVEKATENSYRNNMKLWKANELGPNQVLGVVVDRVAKTNPNGNADMDTVVTEFIRDKGIKGPDGNPMPYEEKKRILDSALGSAMTNGYKSILMPNLEYLRAKMNTQMSNIAASAQIKHKAFVENPFRM